jgi:hypothetical protein
VLAVCGGDQVHYVKSMLMINFVYKSRPAASARVYVNAHRGVEGFSAKMQGVKNFGIISGLSANVSDNLCAHFSVNCNNEGKKRYRNRIRENIAAMNRSIARRLPCMNLHVACVVGEIANFFTELLNVNGVVRGRCGACGRYVSVKKFSQ